MAAAPGDDLVLQRPWCATGCCVGPRRPVNQAGLTVGFVAGDPGLHALARDPQSPWRYGLSPSQPDTGAPSTAGHGKSYGHYGGTREPPEGGGPRQATPHPEVLLTSSQHACYQRPVPVQLDSHVDASADQLFAKPASYSGPDRRIWLQHNMVMKRATSLLQHRTQSTRQQQRKALRRSVVRPTVGMIFTISEACCTAAWFTL